jgi:hypothetical protein
MVMGTRVARSTRAMCLMGAVAAVVLTTFVPAAAAATRALHASGSGTVWLCRPGQAADPCASSRAATAVTASGTTSRTISVPSSRARRFDCFYVYPTVSTETTNNADLTVQPAEVATAVAQASRFSQVCTVWAPMYRQATLAALAKGAATSPTVVATAYLSLLSAWKDYLAHDNDGRPVVFIGHSQGAALLIKLLRAQIDPSRRLRKQMVSAIILGGNVQVPTGGVVGGSFRNIPTCGSATQTGCVIAYSSFGSPPPPNSIFGRAGRGVSLQSGQAAAGGQVACVNPATLSARAGTLQPYFRSLTARTPGVTVRTPWVTFPGLYRAQCEQSGGASWLQVTATPAPGDPRPTVSAVLGPLWGFHLDDVNLALGNLVADVGSEEAAYR